MRKNFTVILTAAFLAVTLTACGGENNDIGEAEPEDTEAVLETEGEDDPEEDEYDDEEDEYDEENEILNNGEYEYIKYADHVKLVKYLKDEEEVTVPDEVDGVPVTTIGTEAFALTENVKKITVPDSVTKIESAAFFGGDHLSEVCLPETIEKIEQMTFQACDELIEMTIPNGVKKIETWAFSGCENLKKVTFPDSVTEIDVCAFYGCISLEDVALPPSVSPEDVKSAFDKECPWYRKNYKE